MPVRQDLLLGFPLNCSLFPFSARRFTLGERLESGLLAVLEECVDAAYSKNKRTQLSNANRRLSSVRHLWRLAEVTGAGLSRAPHP